MSTKGTDNADELKDSGSEPDSLNDGTEHKTHTTALALLSVATFIIIVVILSVKHQVTNPGADVDVRRNQVAQQKKSEAVQPTDAAKSDGSTIPVKEVKTTKMSDLAKLPDSLTLPEDVSIQQNYQADFGSDGIQRVVIYKTAKGPQQIADNYESQLKQAGFTMKPAEENDEGLVMKASRGNERITITTNQVDGQRRVQVNYIKL